MSTNRLFIYDPEKNIAVCIAKGYTDGWATHTLINNDFFDEAIEFTGQIKSTRFELRTERDLPNNIKIYWDSGPKMF